MTEQAKALADAVPAARVAPRGGDTTRGRPVVLQVLPSLVTGGVERGAADVAAALAAGRGRAVGVFPGGPRGRGDERGRAAGDRGGRQRRYAAAAQGVAAERRELGKQHQEAEREEDDEDAGDDAVAGRPGGPRRRRAPGRSAATRRPTEYPCG